MEIAIAPEPAPKSITETGPGKLAMCFKTSSTSPSVSGRGTNTPGPTTRFKLRKPAVPVMY